MILASGAVLEHALAATSGSAQRTCARYLPVDERILIGDGLREGSTMTRIAADLGRSTSTITREVHRNSDERGAYRPFAAHSPWPRPTNENTNGVLRDHLQKGTGLATHSAKRLREVQDELNNRLRKCLNWETPPTASCDYSQTIRKPELRLSLEFACPQVGPD